MTDKPQHKIINNGLLPHLCGGTAVFGLVIAGELLALALVLFDRSLLSFSWQQLGYTSMVVQWVILLSALCLCRLSSVLNRGSPVVGGALAYGVVLLIALSVLLVAQQIIAGKVNVLSVVRDMLLTAIFAGIFLRFLYLQQQLRNQQQAELQSRIQALHARIRPHFLFNAMNAVASLIPVNPTLAETVVEDLCRLFRASLQAVSLVPFADEIDLCQRYMEIEKVRLGERLQIRWLCNNVLDNPDVNKTSVPSLFLQPLLENAIYHGIQRLPEGGLITVDAWLDHQGGLPVLTVTVTNPVPTLEDNQTDTLTDLFDEKQHNHMALSNIEYRLRAHYGKGASIHQALICDQGIDSYKVTVVIPVEDIR